MPGYPLRDRASGVTVLGMSDMDVVFLVIALIGLGVGLISVPKHPPFWLAKNINTQVIRICFIKSGHEKDFLYSNYTDNRSWIMWAKEGHYSTGPSGANVDAGRKDVLFLVTTTKIQEAQRKLIEFMNSSLIPHSINVEISAFNDVLNQDTELMMHVMDERMHQDENYFIQNMNMGTSFYGVIVTDYARRIIPLKPAADRVLSAIATTWKINPIKFRYPPALRHQALAPLGMQGKMMSQTFRAQACP
jgi:hypothetical protein